MATQPTPINDSYTVTDAGTVLLTVKIGNLHVGNSLVQLNGANVTSGPAIQRAPVGVGAAVRGRQLTVKSLVTATNPATKRMIVTYTLEGGTQPKTVTSTGEVDSPNDSLQFDATFSLQ